MASNSNPPVRDYGHYGLIVGYMALFVAGIGLIAFLISVESRATRAEQEVIRAELTAEAEETRRYVAEEIAKANERAAVNAIRINHLNEQVKPSQDPPPEN